MWGWGNYVWINFPRAWPHGDGQTDHSGAKDRFM